MTQYTNTEPDVIELRQELGGLLRRRVVQAIEIVLDEELTAALGCGRYDRAGERRGYRHGSEEREITTELGRHRLSVPRGRLFREDGSTEEYRSQVLPRYARRTRRVDDAILGAYLAGANTRRIRKALEPLLGKRHLSKSAVSRVVGRLKDHFAAWDSRDLSEEQYMILFLDAINLKVRLARRVVSAPVLVVLGVTPDGERRVVALRLAVSEAAACWGDLIADLHRRGLPTPWYVVSDGHAGLKKALTKWPEAKLQRCTVHKLTNLRDHCPKHAHQELRRDYEGIVAADSERDARQAYDRFVAKWSRLCPPVARSIQEAGLELLTFYELPKPLWRSVRSTNCLENLNREFRRRTKTQGSFSTESAACTLLFGLVAFGQIPLRRIDGYRSLTTLMAQQLPAAA